MPVDLGYFIIKKPRVSPINAIATKPPSSQGTLVTYPAFSITYNGSAYLAIFTLTGSKVMTLIDENVNHPDNLNLEILGMTIGELVAEINKKPNYSCSLLTANKDYLCFLLGANRQNILATPYTVRYNSELEYFVDNEEEGKLGSSSIDFKEGNFKYSDVDSKWMLNEGAIYDGKNLEIPSSGVVGIGNDGVEVVFYPAASTDNNDISKTVTFKNLELTASLGSPTSQIPFQGAPILVDGTLELKINQTIKTEDLDYKVEYGTLPEIVSKNSEPYNITDTSNVFRIRFDSDDVQEFTIPAGSYTIRDLATIINPIAKNFQVMEYKDTDTKLKYFTVQAFRGTFYHQLRIEDGSVNSVLGYSNFSAKKGEGTGTLNFLTHVINETLVPTEKINSFVVSGTKAITGNPFIGVNTDNFVLYENDTKKRKDIDFFIDTYGTVVLSDIVVSEQLTGGILTKDTHLFPDDYTLYADGKKLIKETDYTITPEKGWVTLTTSAFPGSVYTADYKHENYGSLVGDVLLGQRATVTGTKKSPFSFTENNNNLIFEVNGVEANITFPSITGMKASDVVAVINNSGTDYVASVFNYCISISTYLAGPDKNIKIKPCSALSVLGFTPNQSAVGSGAAGGEQSLEVPNTPMILSGFVAPSGGDTIIIKNNDVRERYPSGAIINISNDYYEVSSSYLVTEANILGTVSEPYTVLEGTNDTFVFEADGVPYSVTLKSGFKFSIYDIVNQINAVKSGSAEAALINGTFKIKMRAENKISIGNGTANRLFGFDYKSEDTNIPDTYIKVTSTFKNTYVSPDLYTTVAPVVFIKDLGEKEKTPKNSNSINFLGDQTAKYKVKTLIKFNSIYYYEVLGAAYDSDTDKTSVTFLSPLEIAIYSDTLTEYTSEPIVNDGAVNFKTKFYPNMDQPYALRKNGVILVPDKDYELSNTGDIELKKGLYNGDSLDISYVAKRFVGPETTLRVDYTYFDYLRKGSNIKISYTAINPDNFFIKVQHGTSLMKSYQKELEDRNKQIANSSSSGFPTGEIPSTDSSTSGSDSYIYRLGIIDEKIELATKWYSYFDTRLFYFEKERELINGYKVGAESGRVTSTDISNSVNTPPTRLFPSPDTRPEEQRTDPLRVPALDGYNKNDAGSDTNGWVSTTIRSTLNDEKSKIDSELSKLNTLLGMSVSSGSTSSTGAFDIPLAGESMTLYIERRSGSSLLQNTVVVSFSAGYSPPPPCPLNSGGDVGGGWSAQTPSYIASQINSACSFLGVSPASVSGSSVVLNASSSSALCVYVVSDAPHVGFGTGSCAAIRSRHTLWTGGYTNSYSMVVPGSSSVHLDITSANSTRATNTSLHNTQLSEVQGQMDEWVSPFDIAFSASKIERSNISTWIGVTAIAASESSAFDDRKSMAQYPFNAIDDNSTISDRIAYLNFRKNNEIIPRDTRVVARLDEIQSALTFESLYNPRYLWLSVLTNKNNGLYTDRKVEVDNEARRQAEAVRNANTLNCISSFG